MPSVITGRAVRGWLRHMPRGIRLRRCRAEAPRKRRRCVDRGVAGEGMHIAGRQRWFFRLAPSSSFVSLPVRGHRRYDGSGPRVRVGEIEGFVGKFRPGVLPARRGILEEQEREKLIDAVASGRERILGLLATASVLLSKCLRWQVGHWGGFIQADPCSFLRLEGIDWMTMAEGAEKAMQIKYIN